MFKNKDLSTWYFNRRAFGIYPNLTRKDRVIMWHGIVSNYDEYADKNRTEVGVEKNKEG